MKENILSNLNTISEKLFKSVEGEVYDVLDKIVVIGPNILKDDPLKKIFFENKANGIIIIANTLILFYIIYYLFTQIVSLYNGNKVENVYYFILKVIIVGIIVNSSYFLCEQILNLFDGLSDAINIFTKDILGKEATFSNLKESILSIKDFMKSDILSLDGIIKGVVSFGVLGILISFSIRYVTIIFLIIISPIAFVTLCSNFTSGIFKNWLKTFFTLFSVQIITKLIIIIPLAYKDKNNIIFKIILVGSIYILYRITNFTKDFLVKISGDNQVNNVLKL